MKVYVSEVSQNQSNTIFLFFWLVDLSGVQREELFFRNTTIISKHPLVVRTLRPPTMCLDVSKETKTKKLHSHFRLMVFPKDNRDTFRILRGNIFGIPRMANFQYLGCFVQNRIEMSRNRISQDNLNGIIKKRYFGENSKIFFYKMAFGGLL